MTLASFSQLNAEALRLRGGGDAAGATALLQANLDTFPLHKGLVALTLAAAFAEAGRPDDALAALDRALEAGCRYRADWLTQDARLGSLRSLPRFGDIVRRADAAYKQAAAAAKPHLTFTMPDTLPDAFGYPLLMVLHGNNSNAKETAPHWASIGDAGWVVAVPQSTEVGASPDAYTWNDRENTASQLDLQMERVKRATQIDASRIVLAGFSMGGLQAIALPLTRRIKARGFLAVCAWLPEIKEFTALVEGGAGKMLRGYVIVGQHDPSREGASGLVDLFTTHKLKAALDLRAGLGHEYPTDMAATLLKALAFLTG